MLKNKKQTFNFIIRLTIFFLIIFGAYRLGYLSRDTVEPNKIIKAKEEIITDLTKKYNNLLLENQKNQALINAITDEIKRLSHELKELNGNNSNDLIFNEKSNTLGLNIVAEHIKTNEAFSAIPYIDSDGKYRNGYGTLAKLIPYQVGESVKIRNKTNQIITIVATEENQLLPESLISEQTALKRKENHLIKHVFPYLYGKHFRSQEEFIVATDVIYNRGIKNSKQLFTSNGDINCKALYNYMNHSKKAYQKTMQKRYAKNYALCIQS